MIYDSSAYWIQVRALIALGADEWHSLKAVRARMKQNMSAWANMDDAPRMTATGLESAVVPNKPGVYAWYRDGKRVYVGKAACLRARVVGNHRGRQITRSAFQRNVAELLGIAASEEIKARRYVLSDGERRRVHAWIDACEIAWLICASDDDAKELETTLKSEFRPPLTKR